MNPARLRFSASACCFSLLRRSAVILTLSAVSCVIVPPKVPQMAAAVRFIPHGKSTQGHLPQVLANCLC